MSLIVILLFDVGAVTAGMAGRALFSPGLEDAETIFPVLSSELFPPLITGVHDDNRPVRHHVNGRFIAFARLVRSRQRYDAEDYRQRQKVIKRWQVTARS